MHVAVGLVVVMAGSGCELVFPISGGDDDGGDPDGPRADGPGGGSDAAIDADPSTPFCAKPGAPTLFCVDFETPETGLPRLTTDVLGTGGLVDELAPDGVAPTRTLRSRLPEEPANIVSYALAFEAFPIANIHARIRLRVRGSQPSDSTCEPNVVQILLGQQRGTIALQATDGPGYRLTYTRLSTFVASQAFPFDPAVWHDVEIVVDGPGGQAYARIDSGMSNAVNDPDIMVTAANAPVELQLGVAIFGMHGDCEFRFDDVTIEELK